MTSIEKEFKTAAHTFGTFLKSQGVSIKHTVLLSELAKTFGHRNWNTLQTKLAAESSLANNAFVPMDETTLQAFEIWTSQYPEAYDLSKGPAMRTENPYASSITWKAYEAWCASRANSLGKPVVLPITKSATKLSSDFDPKNPEIWDGEYGVSLEYIGEGLNGEYDEANPEDIPLMRLDFMQKEDGAYLDGLDGSACTFVSYHATPEEKLKFVQNALACVWAYIVPEKLNYKQLAGKLSYMDETWDGILP